ncbi:MAG: hypothetical protein JJ921_08605 [Pseudomonadales bacterium]|nr:hypothetical protein [Pseudomonadales bacterium]
MSDAMKPKPTQYMRQTRESYEKLGFEPYQWFEAEDGPEFVRDPKPLSESRLGVISTAGTYVSGQVAFYTKDDTSIRSIPSTTSTEDIRFAHIMENYLVEARQDPCTVFPINALNQLQDEGVVGELADNFFSCMGGIYSRKRVETELIPNLDDAVKREKLDLLLLVPL